MCLGESFYCQISDGGFASDVNPPGGRICDEGYASDEGFACYIDSPIVGLY